MAETRGWDWDRALGEMPGRWTETAGELRLFADLAAREGARRVYDIGCGAGRHTAYLAMRGFEVTASDVSPSALEHTRRILADAGLSARLLRSDIRRSPLVAATFDAVVAFNVVYHATRPEVEAVIDAVAAILAPGGLLLITFKSTLDDDCGRGRQLAPMTWAPVSGIEAGIAHYYADEAEVRRLMAPFEIVSLVLKQEFPPVPGTDRWRAHWVVVARAGRAPGQG